MIQKKNCDFCHSNETVNLAQPSANGSVIRFTHPEQQTAVIWGTIDNENIDNDPEGKKSVKSDVNSFEMPSCNISVNISYSTVHFIEIFS